MEAFLTATGLVTLAEMGDKTQLLAIILATRFKKPWPIVWGILIATLLNHALAGAVGTWVTTLISADTLKWILVASFVVMGIWTLFPDKADDAAPETGKWGVLLTTIVVFFLAEMGDKTQLATVAIAAQYSDFLPVVVGTTLGMMIANAPVVFLGEKLTRVLPLKVLRLVASGLFLLFGAWIAFLS
ncbi:TMEM165/GDT1 family protein [Limnobacter alexandrii]|uniref:TMEM165/GDT1 family protein n=1 Tax=Limnobacter alexandrii TaxID=2570352 RepID=UPI001108D5E1|nr:TMEM165/GDT1 family protein [Limnobacter alexandrii]